MSTVKSKKLQVGTDATSSNNFTIYQPATPDGTLRIGVGNADSPTEVARFDSVPSYSARAWVNFDGGTPVIRASGNVSSITDNDVGDYTVNFTTNMVDNNFSAVASSGQILTGSTRYVQQVYGYSTSSISIEIINAATNPVDPSYVSIAVFR